MKFRMLAVLLVACVTASTALAQSVTFEESDADVWLSEQAISGDVSFNAESGTLFVGSQEYAFDVEEGSFSTDVVLSEGENAIVACVQEVCSDTLRWTLRYELRPEIYAHAAVEERTVTLHAEEVGGSIGPVETFAWQQDASNPTAVSLTSVSASDARFTIAESAPHGEYYFDVIARNANGDEGRARTFVTVDSTGVVPFDIWTDHASWVDRAIVYEVTPYIFENNGQWRDVTRRLPELAELGINTLWIQPVFNAQSEGPGTSGQGYGITDYFELRTDLGTEADLRELVRTAKEEYGMRVLFDFVPNHTSLDHRYAQDVIDRGTSSHYYDFYLSEEDNAPYSQHYTQSSRGPFLYYFWDRLLIIDWSNPEVYRWMMEAGRKWIEEFDIDGYRVDAVWGVNARTPEAMQQWRFDLKRYKPEIFLLGEDKATWSSSFDRRFDAAYDWYPEEEWVSHWTWQTSYSASQNHTIFNSDPVGARSERLRNALTNNGDGWHPDAKVFRFLQNNDTFAFIESHGIERTRMAATLLFALPGIPMIYNGQEIGHDDHPYGTSEIFEKGQTIRSQDPHGLFELHRDLAALRSEFPALYSDTYEELNLSPDNIGGHTFAFRRWSGDQHVMAVMNMSASSVRARLELPTGEMGLSESDTYYLTDLLTGEYRSLSGGSLRFPVFSVAGYSTELYILGEDVVEVPTDVSPPEQEYPTEISLGPNYPNPFNPTTTIAFEVPNAQDVTLRVFDVLGREVATLLDERVSAGRHEVRFEARSLASGWYVYRLASGGHALTRQMLLVK